MAAKKGKKPAKPMGKKDMKRTKGGMVTGSTQPLYGIKGENTTTSLTPTSTEMKY